MDEGPHHIRVLGPVDVLVNGHSAPVAGRRKRALLASLGARAGTLVSRDDLFEAVWPEGAPAKARGALRVHVSHLRRMLRANDTIVDPISTGDDGYGLMRGVVDAQIFEKRCATARSLRIEAPEEARRLLAEGLGLWRAESPLPELSDVEWARPEITRLSELRREALGELIDLQLRCGEHASLIPELEAGIEADPLNERGWAQLMLALYRSGQQSRALEAYQRARHRLIEGIGVEPTPALGQLEHQILIHDPTLLLDTHTIPQSRDELSPVSGPGVIDIRALEPDAKAVVDAAGVLGDRVPISTLSAVSGIGDRGFLAALDDCERSNLLQVFDGEVAIASLALGALVMDDLGRVARAHIHARATESLRKHPLADPDRQADALARHAVGAIGIAPAEEAVDACLDAGRRAEARSAFEVAAAHYRSARLATQHSAGADDHRRGLNAAIRESDCLMRTGAVSVAVPIISYVIEEARSRPDPELFAEAVLVASRQESMISDHPRGALLREALMLLPKGPLAPRVRLLSLLALTLVMTDRAREREQLACSAVTMARSFPAEPLLLAEALAARCQTTFHAGNLAQRIAWATEAADAALASGDDVRAAHALLYCAAARVEDGDRTKTGIALKAAKFHAKRATDARYRWACGSWDALLELADANYDEGERLSSSALSHWGATPNTDAVSCYLVQLTMVALMQGDMTTAAESLTAAIAESPNLLGARFMLAYALAADRSADADRLIDEMGPEPLAVIGEDQTQMLCWAMLAEAAGVLGPRPWTVDLEAAIAPHADQHVVINMLGGGGFYWGSLSHHLGTVQLVLGREDDARASFGAALVAHQSFGARWWIERTGRALRSQFD